MKEGKKAKFKLGVYDPKLGSAIQEMTSIPCIANEMVSVFLRTHRSDIALRGLTNTLYQQSAHSHTQCTI